MFWFTFLLYNISSYFQTVGPTRIQGQSITSHPVMFLFVSPLTDNLYQIKEEGDLLLVFDFRNSYLMGCCMPLFWCHASAYNSSWSAWCLELTSFLFIEIMAGRCSEVSAELLAAVRTGHWTRHNALPSTWTFNIETLDKFLKWRHHLTLGKPLVSINVAK